MSGGGLDPGIVNFFVAKGYTAAQAKGIAAGIQAESASNPNARNPDSGALGLGQWLGSRQQAIISQFGSNPTKPQQLEFLHQELQGGDPGGASVLAQRTPQAVMAAYVRNFMRPGVGAGGDIQRGNAALGLSGGGGQASNPGGDIAAQTAAWRQSHQNAGPDPSQFPDIRQVAQSKLQKSTPIPAPVIAAYNSHQMSDDDRAVVDKYVQDGTWFVPQGQRLQNPGARSFGEDAGLVAGSVAKGLGGALDTGMRVAFPIAAAAHDLLGAPRPLPSAQAAVSSGLTAIGAPQPENDTERLVDAGVQGATQGLLAGPLAGGEGLLASVSDTALNAASGATSGVSSEAARQAGAGPVGQTLAGLAGGALPVGLAGTAERAGARLGAPKTLHEVVAQTPRAAVIDEAGNLTPHGQEVATRHNVTPDDLKAAYEAPPEVQASTANDQMPPSQAAAAGDPVKSYVNDYIAGKWHGTEPPLDVQQFAANHAPEIEAEFQARAHSSDAGVKGGGKAPGDVSLAPEAAPPPAAETVAAPKPAGEALPAAGEFVPYPAATPRAASAETIPDTPAARIQQANDFGFGLSRGMATRDFATQVAEQNLRKMDTPEGVAAQNFTADNARQVKAATEKFTAAFSDPNMTAEERGNQGRAALGELRDRGKAGVSALYKIADELGEAAPLPIDGEHLQNIRSAYDRIMVEADVPDQVKRVLTQEAARYGLIGDTIGTAENGVTSVKLAGDPEGAQPLKYYGRPQTLGLNNIEELHQVVNQQWKADGPQKLTRVLAKVIDDATEATSAKLLEHEHEGAALPQVQQAARAAHIQQIKTFKGKDIIQDILDWKNGAEGTTYKLKPEDVVNRAFAKTSDLRRLKAVLLTKATPNSVAFWRGLQAHGLAAIFKKSYQTNANLAGEVEDVVSGAKLNSAVKTFGTDKLQVLLDPEEFNSFMKLKRSIGDATIPINGAAPVGSAPWWQRVVGNQENKVTAAFAAAGTAVGGHFGTVLGGGIGRAVGGAVKASNEAKAAAETLKGVTDYTPEKATNDTGNAKPSAARMVADRAKQAGANSLKAFIDIYGSPRILAPILATSAEANKQ